MKILKNGSDIFFLLFFSLSAHIKNFMVSCTWPGTWPDFLRFWPRVNFFFFFLHERVEKKKLGKKSTLRFFLFLQEHFQILKTLFLNRINIAITKSYRALVLTQYCSDEVLKNTI